MGEECWEGSVSSKLKGVSADQAWSLLGDFCTLQKFHPALATSRRIEGEDGKPGCVRYCSGPLDDGGGSGRVVVWAKERLLELDMAGRSYSYEITENNMGIGKYNATLKVVPFVDGDQGCCEIRWAFKAAPIEGWTRSGFAGYIEGVVVGMGKKVGDALID